MELSTDRAGPCRKGGALPTVGLSGGRETFYDLHRLIRRRYVSGMQGDQAGVEPRAAPKRARGRWLRAAALVVVVAAILFWPRRSISIPLTDGTTLKVAAITTGNDHHRAWPLSPRTVLGQIAMREWRWPVETIRFAGPRTVLWFDDESSKSRTLMLTDQHGWRWAVGSDYALRLGMQRSSAVIESGPGLLEVFDHDRQRLGSADISIPAPETALSASLAAESFPLTRSAGPLSVVVRGLPVLVVDSIPSQAHAHLQLEATWNGRPMVPGFGPLLITDSLGRDDKCLMLKDGRFHADTSPYGVVWDITLEVFRGRNEPLDPEESFSIQPRGLTDREEVWDGEVQGVAWHVTLMRRAGMPVIIVDVASIEGMEIRIEPLDADGKLLPARRVPGGATLPTTRLIGCPTFDPAQGHTLRIGFNHSRTIRFAVRPEIVGEDPDP